MREHSATSSAPPAPSRGVLASVFLLSFCVLSLEIALSRLFSVVLRYHFVFLIISVAICGLGLGGLALHVGRLKGRPQGAMLLRWSAFGFAVSTALTLVLLLRVLFPSHLFSYWTMALLLLVPFFCAGVFLSEAFRQFSAHSGRLYGADLIGAAVASAAVIGMLQQWGAINASLWIAAFALLCLPLLRDAGRGTRDAEDDRDEGDVSRFTFHVSRITPALLLLLIYLALFFFARGNTPHRFLDIQPVQVRDRVLAAEMAKPLFAEELTKPSGLRPTILYTEWTAFARTDVVQDPEVGDDALLVYTNGHVPTHMIRFRGSPQEVEYLRYEVGYFPFRFSRPQQVLCIGPGAGMDVWFGLLSGAQQIDGVEINPSILPIMRMRRFRDFNGGLYDRPNVHIVTGEGRSFVQRSRKTYDLIFLALTQTSTSGHSGLTLMESYVHTLDAFRDYWSILTPNGQIALVTQEPDVAARFFTTGIALLKEKGKSDPAACEHIVLIRVPDERVEVGPYQYLFLLKKTPWTPRETQRMSGIVREPFLHPVFIPRHSMEEQYASVFKGQWTLQDFIDSYRHKYIIPENVAPCTDDAPFFLDLSFGVPALFYGLCAGAFGLVVLFAVLALLWKQFAEKTSPLPSLPFIAYFASLGVGFMLIEIPLLQKLILVLGYPTLALAVILFALLMGGGLGSLFSQRWGVGNGRRAVPEERHGVRSLLVRSLLVVVLAIVLVSSFYAVFLSAPHPTLLRLGIVWRCLGVTALLLPLGFCLGIPFPTGVRLLSNVSPQDVPWMWGVNGVMSVVGSLLAAIGAKLVGFKMVMLGGAGVYALGLVIVLWMRRGMRDEG